MSELEQNQEHHHYAEFEKWWSLTWVPTVGPEVMDLAFKEISWRAWKAAVLYTQTLAKV